MKSLGRRIEELRLEKHFSREEFSSKIGVKATVLRDLEILNSTPRRLQELLPAIARELSVTVHFLLTGDHPRNVEAVLKHVIAIKDHADSILQKINS